MKTRNFFVIGLSLLCLMLFGKPSGSSAAPPELIEAAKKEGFIDFYGPSTLTPQGAAELAKALNKKYGTNIELRFNPSGSMTRDVGKLVGLAATGQPPEWDLMVVTDAHHASLWLKKLLQTYDYKKAGVDPRVVHYDSGAISFANQIVLPAYNTKLVAPEDVPTKWEDILDDKWKGGKLGVIHSTHHWARLAAGPWGEERTTAFVKELAKREFIRSRPGGMYNRLQLGEVLLSATLQDSQIYRAKKAGAPLAQAQIQPVISPGYHAGVPKGAAHPNVGHLFAIFLTTPEAQVIWEKYSGHSSAFVPGSKAYEYAQGKEMVFMDQDQAPMVDRLSKEYSKILGFARGRRRKK